MSYWIRERWSITCGTTALAILIFQPPADFYPAIAVSILVASSIKQAPCRPHPQCCSLSFEAARIQSSVVDRDIKLRVELDTIDDNEAGHRLDDWIVVKCPLQKRFVSFHILELRDHDEVGVSCH